jgi:hypothetical protein
VRTADGHHEQLVRALLAACRAVVRRVLSRLTVSCGLSEMVECSQHEAIWIGGMCEALSFSVVLLEIGTTGIMQGTPWDLLRIC